MMNPQVTEGESQATDPARHEDIDSSAVGDANAPLQRLRHAVYARVFGDAEENTEVVGRYVIERAIGAGGMGTVYAARDPELERRVAIKVLNWTRGSHEERKRLLREAQALARLSHPNVVQVYDAGTHEGQVFLAMELVPGTDLRRWLSARPRSRRAIGDVFVAAGRGLAAAHAAGLVHRDFKPENVLVHEDGTVKVVDFGLVRQAGTAEETSPSLAVLPTPSTLSDELTRTGTAVGTPAYMAPEQHLALPTDARTDQFSFCVALYESLVGVRPFHGDTYAAFIEAVRSDRVAFPRAAALTRRMKAVIRRGLRARPEDRFRDFPTLIDALVRANECSRARVRRVLLLASAVALTGGLLLAQADKAEAACDAEAVDRVWNDGARARVRAQVMAAAPDAGRTASETAVAALDRWAFSWGSVYAQTCDPSADLQESERLAQQACLQRRLEDVDEALAVFAEVDADLARDVPQVVAAIAMPESCTADDPVVARDDPQATRELAVALARARALWHAGRTSAASAALDVAEKADAAGAELLAVDARVLAAQTLLTGGADALPLADVQQHLRAALASARRHADVVREARVAVLASLDDDSFGADARAGLEARVIGSRDPEAMFLFHAISAMSFGTRDEVARRRHVEQLVDLAAAHFGPGHPFAAVAQKYARQTGRRARVTVEEAMRDEAQVQQLFGFGGPRAAEAAMRTAKELARERRFEEAETTYRRALDLWIAEVGERSTQAARTWRHVGHMREAAGKLEDALAAYQAAAEAVADNPPKDYRGEDWVLSAALFSAARVLVELDRPAQAWTMLERARAARPAERSRDPWAETIADVELATGHPEVTLEILDAERPNWGGFQSTGARMLSRIDVGRAEALLALGRTDEAVDVAYLALAEAAVVDRPDERSRRIHFVLAKARVAQRQPAAEVQAAVQTALDELGEGDLSPRWERRRQELRAIR